MNILVYYLRDTIKKYYNNIAFKTDAYCFLPVNLYRLIPIIKDKSNIKDYNSSDLTPVYIINKVNELMDSITKFSIDNNSRC